MRILVAHNAYQQRGGEDSVVADEMALLRRYGHEVQRYGRHNDEIAGTSRPALAAGTLWSARTAREVPALIRQFRPDIVHVHNTFPLISPGIYWAAAAQGVPVVQTLHNFRLLCPQAMFLRAGKVCEDCLGRLPLAGLVHGCYRDSRVQTATLGAMLAVHRGLGTFRRKVSRYIALNEFCRRKFVAGGLPAERIAVKPNFVDFPAPPAGGRAGFLFVGRLSREKGIATLAEALAAVPAARLGVAGGGPEAALLADRPRIDLLGALPAEAVRQAMGRALALVLPSIWYENMPRTLVEAFACGLPVLASRLGAMADLVTDGVTGLLFAPGDAADLAAKLQWALAHPDEMARMGGNARREYEASYTGERNHALLMNIYQEAIDAP